MKFDPIEFVLANATKTLHCFVLFSLLNCSSFWAQDCANDTIPPKIECIADYKICPGLCGNGEVYASTARQEKTTKWRLICRRFQI
ncbi:MAG: hypothetical protein IPP01_12570 [Saprospiraceae bacterium]|nr:hypothetical protein [Saprospiraceae bacterium]